MFRPEFERNARAFGWAKALICRDAELSPQERVGVSRRTAIRRISSVRCSVCETGQWVSSLDVAGCVCCDQTDSEDSEEGERARGV